MNDCAIQHHFASLTDVRLHYVTAGHGTPIVLLHGWPQTWYEWRNVIALLANDYQLIAPDMRGLGDSSKPASGYDAATIAADIAELIANELNIEQYYLAGHDWGGPVSFALAAAHPESVLRLAIIDVAIPGDGSANISQGGKRWHHAFHQTPELPEIMVTGREAQYLGWFYRNYGARPDAIDDEAIEEYLRTYRNPESLRAGFDYYRNIPRDIEQNETFLKKRRLEMPVLALGGTEGWGRAREVLESCQRVANDVCGGVIENAGHWIPEEQPEILAQALREFFPQTGTR